jgi:hypothetical protein
VGGEAPVTPVLSLDSSYLNPSYKPCDNRGNGQSSGTSEQSFETLFHLSGNPDLGLPNDEHVGRGDKAHAFPSIVGMTIGPLGHCRV